MLEKNGILKNIQFKGGKSNKEQLGKIGNKQEDSKFKSKHQNLYHVNELNIPIRDKGCESG